jgi:hypothetical protein
MVVQLKSWIVLAEVAFAVEPTFSMNMVAKTIRHPIFINGHGIVLASGLRHDILKALLAILEWETWICAAWKCV